MTVVRPLALVLAVAAAGAMAARADDKAKQPAPDNGPVSYYKQVRPVLQQHCQGCHQPAKAQGGYVMTSYGELLKKGDSNEPPVIAGWPEQSNLFRQIVPRGAKPPEMPKGRSPLLGHDVDLIRRWIAQGAEDDTPSTARDVVDAAHPPSYQLAPVITSLAYSPDGKLLAVTGYHEVLLHHADGSGLVARLVGLSERVQSLAFSPDGKSLAVTGGDPGRFGEVQIWDVAKRHLKLSVPVTFDTVYGVSWSPDGSKVAFGCGDNTLRAIDVATGKQVLYQGAHSDWVLETVFSKDASHLVSVSRDGSMKLTEVAHQRFVDNITSITPGALKGGLITVTRRPGTDELLAAGADGTPKIYRMHRIKKREIGDDFNLLQTFPEVPGRVFCTRFNAEGNRIVVATSLNGTGEVRVYKSGPDRPSKAHLTLAALPGKVTKGLTALATVPGQRTGQLVCKCEGQKGGVFAAAFQPDGRVVASAGFDGVVRLNDAATGKLIKEFVPVPLNPPRVTAAK